MINIKKHLSLVLFLISLVGCGYSSSSDATSSNGGSDSTSYNSDTSSSILDSSSEKQQLETNYHSFVLDDDYIPITKEELLQDVVKKYSFEYEYAHLEYSNRYATFHKVSTIERIQYEASLYPKYNMYFGIVEKELFLVDRIIDGDYELECTKAPYTITIFNDEDHKNKILYIEYNDYFNPVYFEYNPSGNTKGKIRYFNKTDLPKGPGILSTECAFDYSFYTWQDSTLYSSRTLEIVGSIDEYMFYPATIDEPAKEVFKASYRNFRVIEKMNKLSLYYGGVKNNNVAPYLFLQDDTFINIVDGDLSRAAIEIINNVFSNSNPLRVGFALSQNYSYLELDKNNYLYDYYKAEDREVDMIINSNNMAEKVVWRNSFLMNNSSSVLIKGDFEVRLSYSTEQS